MSVILNQITSWFTTFLDAILNQLVEVAGVIFSIFPSSPAFLTDIVDGIDTLSGILLQYDWLLPVQEMVNLAIFFMDLMIVAVVLLMVYWALSIAILIGRLIRG